MSNWEKLDKCPVCGNLPLPEKHTVFQDGFKTEVGGMEAPAVLRLSYSTCFACGVMFMNPRPNDKMVKKMYETGEYRRSVLNENQTQEVLDLGEMSNASRIFQLVKGSPLTALDVGCSRGYLLARLKREIGCQTYGVEPNQEYVQEVPDTLFTSLDEVQGQYELITAIHVLEHVNHPLQFMEKLAFLLAEDGQMILEVPSSRSPGSPFRLAHPFFFPTWSLILLIGMVGLSLRHVTFSPHTTFVLTKGKS